MVLCEVFGVKLWLKRMLMDTLASIVLLMKLLC